MGVCSNFAGVFRPACRFRHPMLQNSDISSPMNPLRQIESDHLAPCSRPLRVALVGAGAFARKAEPGGPTGLPGEEWASP